MLLTGFSLGWCLSDLQPGNAYSWCAPLLGQPRRPVAWVNCCWQLCFTLALLTQCPGMALQEALIFHDVNLYQFLGACVGILIGERHTGANMLSSRMRMPASGCMQHACPRPDAPRNNSPHMA